MEHADADGGFVPESLPDLVLVNRRDNIQHPRLPAPDVLFSFAQQVGQLPGATHPELWSGDFLASGHDTNSTVTTDSLTAFRLSGHAHFLNAPNKT
ncbi:hypothetical protein [Fodinicola feengrottensis]|uniref:hypothetical protein n=1 Tax=Fodinicola feengrottensis TaxID=435914 RepID=UPI002440F5E0|nr:hypothetical protein [Fodinicola feengrottensis]